MQRFVYDSFHKTENKEDFNLDDILLKSFNYHNNNMHSSTKFKSIDIREIDNNDIISIVNKNIEKAILRVLKYKNIYLLEENDYSLVNNNIKTNN